MGRLRLAVGVALMVLIQAGLGAVHIRFAPEDIQRATDLARFPHSDAERAQFHSGYTFTVHSPIVDYFGVETIEVITPFRKLELIAEEHARVNDLFARGGLQDAEEALRPWRDHVTLLAHLRFDFTKTIPGAPTVDMAVVDVTGASLPISINSTEVYSGSGDQMLLVGGLVEAVFDIQDVPDAREMVVVSWHGKDIASASVNFAALE